MNMEEETRTNEKSGPARDRSQRKSQSAPSENPAKEFEEYLQDIGVRI